MFQNSTIPILQQVASFTQARHGVLAGNLANIDTPGYRTQDLSPEKFAAQLQEAIAARQNGGAPESIGAQLFADPVSQGVRAAGDPVEDLDEQRADLLYHDDSNVSLEQQVAELNKNQIQHNLALTLLVDQYRQIKTAISERVA